MSQPRTSEHLFESKEELHQLRNEIQALSIGLQLYRHEMISGQDGEDTFCELTETIERIAASVGMERSNKLP